MQTNRSFILIIEIKFSLQITAIQCENFSLLSDEFPIEIRVPSSRSSPHPTVTPTRARASGGSTPVWSSRSNAASPSFSSRRHNPNLHQQHHHHGQGSAWFLRNRTVDFGLSPSRSPSLPPRYSSLSLPALRDLETGHSSSCETCKPISNNYSYDQLRISGRGSQTFKFYIRPEHRK